MTESVTTGAAPEAAPHAAQSWGRAAYDAYAEGLYTYCLSVLRDHAAAASSLRSTFVLADRHIGRLPDLGLLKPWLYALARYECLVRLDGAGPATVSEALSDEMAGRASDLESGRVFGGVPGGVPGGVSEDASEGASATASEAAPGAVSDAESDGLLADQAPAQASPQARRAAGQRAELALLTWPEAVGLEPEEREALELSVRHGLEPRGLAAVLGWDEDHARRALLHAGREVDRTRAALEGARAAVSCPEGPGLAAEVATPGVRDRLVDHVDVCRRCRPHVRLAAARLTPTAGAAAAPWSLPAVEPPDELRAQVLGDVGRGRSAHRPAELTRRVAEFDRSGFPVFRVRTERGRSGRRRMAVAAAVVVAIVAAVPAIALWEGAQREHHPAMRGTTISAARVTTLEPGELGTGTMRTPDSSRGADPARPLPAASTAAPTAPQQSGGRSAAQVPQTQLAGQAVGGVAAVVPAAPQPVAPPAPGAPGGPSDFGSASPAPTATAPVVTARHDRDRTVITVRNTGAVPVDWTASTTASWLRLSRTSGTLAPGQTDSITVTVDSAKAPDGSWSANVLVQPGGSQVTIEGSTGPGGTPSTSAKPTTSGPTPPSPTSSTDTGTPTKP